MAQLELIWSQIERSFEAGRLAHAWMVVGNPGGNAGVLARRMAAMVLSEGQDEKGRARVEHLATEGTHPDLCFVEPHSKSRRITTDEIRELNLLLHATSYEGGWKVAIIRSADRLMPNAANAFLKTLEEPPPRTLILLLTDSPQTMLNTIVSRCQRLILSEDLAEMGDPVWSEHLTVLLENGWPVDASESLALASAVSGILGEQEAEITKRVKSEQDDMVTKEELTARIASQLVETRADMIEFMIHWYRDVLVQAHQAGEGCLHFAHKQEDTQREAERIESNGSQQCLGRLWDLQTALERNVPVDGALLNALRPIQLAVVAK